MSKYSKVYFNPDGDGVTALYKDGKILHYGDYYHDKIDDFLEGFKEGLKECGATFTWDTYSCEDEKETESVCECGNSPNEDFSKLNNLEQLNKTK